jgi:hypothetical protein
MRTRGLILLALMATFAGAHAQGNDCGEGATLCVDFEANTRFEGQGIYTRSKANIVKWFALNQAAGQCNGDRADDTSRIALIDIARTGAKGLKFTTQDLDDCVHGSKPRERSMANLSEAATGATQGAEQWWAHSVYFPQDFVMPAGNWRESLFFQFNHDKRGCTMPCPIPNIALDLFNQPGTAPRLVIRARTHGKNGLQSDGRQYTYSVPGARNIDGQCIEDNPVKGVWYDFVHHIRWSATGDGFHRIWMRRAGAPVRKVLERQNVSNLYETANPAYLSIGTYHDPLPGVASSVIHDRYRRGNSFAAVAMRDFEMPSGPITMCKDALR